MRKILKKKKFINSIVQVKKKNCLNSTVQIKKNKNIIIMGFDLSLKYFLKIFIFLINIFFYDFMHTLVVNYLFILKKFYLFYIDTLRLIVSYIKNFLNILKKFLLKCINLIIFYIFPSTIDFFFLFFILFFFTIFLIINFNILLFIINIFITILNYLQNNIIKVYLSLLVSFYLNFFSLNNKFLKFFLRW